MQNGQKTEVAGYKGFAQRERWAWEAQQAQSEDKNSLCPASWRRWPEDSKPSR